MVFVAGRNLVPAPATATIAFLILGKGFIVTSYFVYFASLNSKNKGVSRKAAKSQRESLNPGFRIKKILFFLCVLAALRENWF
jgi:hypothetical protein